MGEKERGPQEESQTRKPKGFESVEDMAAHVEKQEAIARAAVQRRKASDARELEKK